MTMNKKGGIRRGESERTDRNGNKIEKGVKSHRITFKDNLQEDEGKIADVYIVESYKKYNQENTYSN